ncbi:MAG TPA: hypothetical protein VNF91_08990 [Candidatus Acidoferrum sp.]|nr:hypothetical protein [Candidatus Acidoferrum sp.]
MKRPKTRKPSERLMMARRGACVPFEDVSCFDVGIPHTDCASLLLDGLSVEEVTQAERELRRENDGRKR